MTFAIFVPLATVFMALAVDLGAISLQKRELQNTVDLAAIAATMDIENYQNAAMLTVQANGHDTVVAVSLEKGALNPAEQERDVSMLDVRRGHYSADASRLVAERFVADAEFYNAVRVTVSHPARLHFGASLIKPPTLEATGVAQVSAEAAFSIGSRLLRLEDGILNAVLNGLLGTNVSLTVMDYRALLDFDVSLLHVFDQIASDIHLTGATYDDVLQSDVTIAQLASAMAEADHQSLALKTALRTIAADPAASELILDLDRAVDLGSIGKLRTGDADSETLIQAQALDMLTGTATAADGDHQVSLDLGLDVPGLSRVSVTLLIGERPLSSPWLSMSSKGQTIRTAQTRLLIETELLGTGLLAGTKIHLPLFVELAASEAELASVSCPTWNTREASVGVDVRPGLATVRIADIDDRNLVKMSNDKQSRYAHLVDAPLLDIHGWSKIEIADLQSSRLTYTQQDIDSGVVKTATMKDFPSSLVMSAIGNLNLKVKAAGLGLSSPALLQKALAGILLPVAEPLDELIANVLAISGIHLGEADVRVNGIRCQRAVLVQ